MAGQTGFVSGRRVLVQDFLINHLVDQRDGRNQLKLALLFIVGRQRVPQFLDLSSKTAAVAAVNQVPLGVLPHALLCRLVIRH